MNFISKFLKRFRSSSTPIQTESQTENRDQDHVMTDDEKVDEASMESMIASDPPGHISKTTEDKNLH